MVLFHSKMQAISLLTIQVLEFNAALVVLKSTAKPQYKFSSFFENNKLLSDRNWFLSSALGFGFIALLVCLTSLLADRLLGFKVSDYIYLFCNFICIRKAANVTYLMRNSLPIITYKNFATRYFRSGILYTK